MEIENSDDPSINPVTLIKYDKACRACLNEYENMISIYHPDIKNMFTYCTSLEVSLNTS